MKQMISLAVCVAVCVICCSAAQSPATLDERYRDVAGRLIGAALVDTGAWAKLAYLTTRIGCRLNGSPELERAVTWAAETMRADGLENVKLQPVKVPHWVRGRESARVVEPFDKSLSILGLGSSVGTPPQGITAPVVVVGSFDELEKLQRDAVAGRIVLYDMPWAGYGRTVRYRDGGAARAAKLGAVAVLVRSVTSQSLYTPHTGNMHYDPTAPKIPAAAVTVEDAAWIRQMITSGLNVKVRLQMEATMLPDADSANVIGEITGRESDEVVVLGGHIDSWDVGQGAQDDGGGVVAAWQAVTLMKRLGLHPRRTVRVVLWTNEENGNHGMGGGGLAYRAGLGPDVRKHVAAIESDGGVESPEGFGLSIHNVKPGDPNFQSALATLQQIGGLLVGVGAGSVMPGEGGNDIQPLMNEGIPGLDLRTVERHYFEWHHSAADTLDKVDPQDLRRCVAALAVMAYILADMPEGLVSPSPIGNDARARAPR